ncbi:retrovirus-related pol polyprotein from transposon TNT 1-94, partial [Tanacetum coccineum]
RNCLEIRRIGFLPTKLLVKLVNPATPATPFVHKSRPPSQVLASLQKVNDVFPQFEEFEQIFDELEAKYEQCVLDNKNLTIEKKNLLIRNDGLIAECLETPQVIEKFIVKTQRALNATVRFVRTDNGTEFMNKTLDRWFESVGISHETSVPRSPQQNGIVERRNRTLMEAARTML